MCVRAHACVSARAFAHGSACVRAGFQVCVCVCPCVHAFKRAYVCVLATNERHRHEPHLMSSDAVRVSVNTNVWLLNEKVNEKRKLSNEILPPGEKIAEALLTRSEEHTSELQSR